MSCSRLQESLTLTFTRRGKANHQFCSIHLPSTGVAGTASPCIPGFDKEMETRRGLRRELLRTARELNDEMVGYWSERIIMEA